MGRASVAHSHKWVIEPDIRAAFSLLETQRHIHARVLGPYYESVYERVSRWPCWTSCGLVVYPAVSGSRRLA